MEKLDQMYKLAIMGKSTLEAEMGKKLVIPKKNKLVHVYILW